MFVKDGKKTKLEKEIAALPPGNEDPQLVKSQQDANASPDDKSGVREFIDSHIHPSKDKGELLDIHVGNPLRRITEILEDIKKQKAFSFTLKGSLGILGVGLALSVFGLFGGSKMLCDKGTQSYVGTVRQLTYIAQEDLPLLTQLTDAYSVLIGGRPHEKPAVHLVLIQQDKTTINLKIARSLDRGGPVPEWFANVVATAKEVIITGNYDSCSRTLVLNQTTAIEPQNR